MTELTYRKSTPREYFESLVITVILALFGTTFIVQAFKIPTPSMEDNLLVGDHLLDRVGAVRKGAMGPAFTVAECDAVRDWVRIGGSLLLIADHVPWGDAFWRSGSESRWVWEL